MIAATFPAISTNGAYELIIKIVVYRSQDPTQNDNINDGRDSIPVASSSEEDYNLTVLNADIPINNVNINGQYLLELNSDGVYVFENSKIKIEYNPSV